MNVIGHQNIGVHETAVLLRGLTQPFNIKMTIVIFEETWLAIIAALNYMLRNAREIDAGLPCHPGLLRF
jgi:hypothetical protein